MTNNKNAIVTGSTSGIGLATARALAAQGMNIVLNGFGDAQQIETLRTGIAEEFGVQVRYSDADMRDAQAIEAMVMQAIAALGSVDVLVNNAGVQHVSPVEDFPQSKWDQIIAINLSAAFHAVRAAVPGMKQRRWDASSIQLRRTHWSRHRSKAHTSRPSMALQGSPNRLHWRWRPLALR